MRTTKAFLAATLVASLVALPAAVAAPLAVGDSTPAGTDWSVQAQADTLVTGTGYIRLDQAGAGVQTIDGSARAAARVWLYSTLGGVITKRVGPFNLRSQDGPQSLTPPGVGVHLIQFASSDTLKISVRE